VTRIPFTPSGLNELLSCAVDQGTRVDTSLQAVNDDGGTTFLENLSSVPLAVIKTKTKWEAAAETAWGQYLTDAERRVLLRALELAPRTGLAMDVGCEGGRWSQYVIENRGSVVCTDVDAGALQLCASRLPKATCVLTTPRDERLPANDGDLALLLVYEVAPVTNAAWFPLEARRVVGPHGILVFSYLNPVSVRAMLYRVVAFVDRRRRAGPFYRGRSYLALRRSLARAGFEFVHQEGLAWAPFTRLSDSRWVRVATYIERTLGLRRLVSISPWVLVIARRTPSATAHA
jgi:SAM-dependent methyltransferase